MTTTLRCRSRSATAGSLQRRRSQAWHTSGVARMIRDSFMMPSRRPTLTSPSIWPTAFPSSPSVRQDSRHLLAWSLASALVG